MAEVMLNDGKEAWDLVGVYGDPTRDANHVIWEDISGFLDQVEGKACLIGDFNVITDNIKKMGGSSSLGSNNIAFRKWIHSNDIIDLGYQGSCYTWSNKQQGHDNINQRLDRGLGSVNWALMYPNSAIFHLPRFGSDHLPILLRTNPVSVRAKPKFRVEAWWTEKLDFKEVCDRAVIQGQANWAQVKSNLKREVKVLLGDQPTPEVMLCKVEERMAALNAEIPDINTNWKERELNKEHQQILQLKERYWYQRSRVQWVLLGYDNTHFFHATAVTRKSRNTIRAVQMESSE